MGDVLYIENLMEVRYLSDVNPYKNIDQQIAPIEKKFPLFRAIGSDGNSFYNAVGFAYIEHLICYGRANDLESLMKLASEINIAETYVDIQENKRKDIE